MRVAALSDIHGMLVPLEAVLEEVAVKCASAMRRRSDEEIVTQATPDRHLRTVLARAGEPVVVAGHTHMQLERRVDDVRWVNAGSEGMPYEGEVAAFWALLGPDVELRRTAFDVERSADAVLESGWPDAETFVAKSLREAVQREDVVAVFEGVSIDRGER